MLGCKINKVTKSVFSVEYRTFCDLLRELRGRKGLTQAELSTALGMAQSFVSKYEMGERRLDFIEVDRICRELGLTVEVFARLYAKALANSRRGKRAKR
jgi:transcriptional regulator with XRE-family HTH domain